MAGINMIIEKCTRSILPLALYMGCGVVERHLEMAQPTKKLTFCRVLKGTKEPLGALGGRAGMGGLLGTS